MTSASVEKRPRDAALDLIRVASIFYIVAFWHLLGYVNPLPPFTNWATEQLVVIALGAFVLISGYLMGAKAIGRTWPDVLRFYGDRLVRIYPPLLVAVAATYVTRVSDAASLIRAAALVSMFAAPATKTLWFATMIVIFYLATPPLVWAAERAGRFAALFAVMLAPVLAYAWLTHRLDLRLVIYFPVFALGILLARRKPLLEGLDARVLVVFVLAAASLAGSAMAPGSPETSLWSIPLAITAPLAIFLTAERFKDRLGHPALAFLGTAGFFMYLFHRAIYAVLVRVYFPAAPVAQLLYLYAICLPAIVVCAWLGQRGYDAVVRYLRAKLTAE